MFKKGFIMTIFVLVFSIILVGCQGNNDTTFEDDLKVAEEKMDSLNKGYKDLEEKNKILEKEKKELETQIENMEESNSTTSNSPINLLDISLDVMEMIKDNDMNTLSSYVHESKGLRFTPYTNIDIQNDQVFTPQEVSNLNGDSTMYNWGHYDGSGEPIESNFASYYSEFVYDQDFLNPNLIGNNVVIGTGNDINNMDTAYPDGSFVEYHFTGFNPEYAGIDWESLTLVFEEEAGSWKLVGIIHGQWTI